MGKLVNIDNGGTLTDFCVLDNGKIYHTKTLTTPFDLSKCFFEGLKKLAKEIYGDEANIDKFIQSTDYIRYSTTQGTNALVERNGPRLGLIVERGFGVTELCGNATESALYHDFLDTRVAGIDLTLHGDAAEMNIVQAVNRITSAGANRIVLSLSKDGAKALEKSICQTIGRKFPSHLLGVVPVISASELADDSSYKRRTWTALMNAFLHPSMERFLYSADHRLKAYKTKNPLLIFRNDGGSARVAKTMAVKTYSSGPCGGMQGAKALATHYGFSHLISYDVGGTTTDIGVVTDGTLEEQRHGVIEGVNISFPMPRIHSAGVGGSSIISANEQEISIGPQSVGAAPGPACFGYGGKDATITDVFLLLGIFDPRKYFGGELTLDAARALNVITEAIATPLALTTFDALEKMRDAWVRKITTNIQQFTTITPNTTLAGFGGAGALAATRIADTLGVKRVIIPGLSAVFSAFGIGFSPLSQEYRRTLSEHNIEALNSLIDTSRLRASRDVFAEGINIEECTIEAYLLRLRGDTEEQFTITQSQSLPCELSEGDVATLLYKTKKSIQHFHLSDIGNESVHPAIVSEQRPLLVAEDDYRNVPVYRLDEQAAGASTEGPAIIEEAFFTGFIEESWRVTVTGNKDLLLEKIEGHGE